MKTKFFKTTMPFAFVAIMGISGAFLTTSMQSVSKTPPPKLGYINGETPCSVPVQCSTNVGPACQANGQQAFGKDNNCTEILSRQF